MFKKRKSTRLKEYDYTQHGAYYVTICTHDLKCLFGAVKQDKMVLNGLGIKADKCWKEIPIHFPHVALDEYIVMPNHVHGIIHIQEGTACRARTGSLYSEAGSLASGAGSLYSRAGSLYSRAGSLASGTGFLASGAQRYKYDDTGQPGSLQRFGAPVPGSLSTIIRSYKSAVTNQTREMENIPNLRLWHRNFYDHVIRDESDMSRIREYIVNNTVEGEKVGHGMPCPYGQLTEI